MVRERPGVDRVEGSEASHRTVRLAHRDNTVERYDASRAKWASEPCKPMSPDGIPAPPARFERATLLAA
jgi:hypothetical protein